MKDELRSIKKEYATDRFYDFNNKTIKIKIENQNYISSLGGYYYYYLFEILFHEIEHAKQYRLCNKYEPYFGDLLKGYIYTNEEMKEIERACILIASNKFSSNSKIKYNLYHDFYPAEHEANYYGYLNATKFLNDILKFDTNLLPYIDKIYNLKLMQLLLNGYKTKLISYKLVSPIEKIIPKSISYRGKKMLLDPEYLDDYDKLILGLPIEYEKYLLYRNTLNEGKTPKDIKQFILNKK